MTRLLLGMTLLALAACGADGRPERPGTSTGVSISGTVSAGISGGS